MPILFFGDLDAYVDSQPRVLTVGLNPSRNEFPEGDPFQRFPLANDAAAADPQRSLDALCAYFRTRPYTQWFNSFEPLLNGMGASYHDPPNLVRRSHDAGNLDTELVAEQPPHGASDLVRTILLGGNDHVAALQDGGHIPVAVANQLRSELRHVNEHRDARHRLASQNEICPAIPGDTGKAGSSARTVAGPTKNLVVHPAEALKRRLRERRDRACELS